MIDLDRAQKAIRAEGLSGWLFYTIFHRDEIADLMFDVPRDATNTRPWACLLLPDGPPVKIVHRIEASILDHVPGRAIPYSTRDEFRQALASVLPREGGCAAQFSSRIPVGSFLDHGTALLIEGLGARLVPSEALVARCLGTMDAEQERSHQAAARVLYGAVEDAWARLAGAFRAKVGDVREGDVAGWIAARIAEAGLVSDGPPLVASGRHTADPHYGTDGPGAALRPGDVVQLDIWARETGPCAVYADISWVGVLAPAPTPAQRELFDALVLARQTAVRFIQEGLTAGSGVRGCDVDAEVRRTLTGLGFARGMRHRTGHSLGGRVHGFGVNLDSIEFPDERFLVEGSCFSVEPGIYLEEYGMRTEIDVYIRGGRLVVSGGEPQGALLTLGEGA